MVSEQEGFFQFILDFLSRGHTGTRGQRYPWKILVIRIGECLSRQSESALMAMGLLGIGMLAMVESLMGSSDYFTVLHAIPMMIVTWFAGKRFGILMSAASTTAGLSLHVSSRALHLSSSVLYQYMGVRLGTFLMIIFILWVMKDSLEHEKEFARTDVLTGIGNRRYFIEGAEIEIARARRQESPFTVIYMDVDDLKVINDTLGHSAGDKVLRALAQAARKKLRVTDLVARLGGDEFGLLLPETGPEVAELIVQRLQAIGAALLPGGHGCVPFSMGVVTFLDSPASVAEMLSISDQTMYTAKKEGKHTVCRQTFSRADDPLRSVTAERQRNLIFSQGDGPFQNRRSKPGAGMACLGR
jgi:diguanylate cyclase (GGDEF)-like protein